ncbi:MAG: hypothetical protein AAF573_15760 [Bacteroidota bacterium]
MIKKYLNYLLVYGMLLAFQLPVFSFQDQHSEVTVQKKKISLLDHFTAISEVLEVTLKMDFKTLVKNKYSENYHPADFSYRDEDQNIQNYEIKVRPRGKLRRKRCAIPPLKLKFRKKDLTAKGFKKHNTFKLVQYCEKGKYGEELVLREYLAYKIFNLITENSFRVHLAKIKYVDTTHRRRSFSRYGFLIEDKKEMAKRLEGKICECVNQPLDSLHEDQYQKVALFNYMIGNTDWRLDLVHNLKLLRKDNDEKLWLIPYDFDFSGLVDADYAIPSPDYKIKSVRQRHYRGYRYDNPIFKKVEIIFLEKETAIKELIKNYKNPNHASQRWIKKYVAEFYRILKTEKKKQKYLVPDRIKKKKTLGKK